MNICQVSLDYPLPQPGGGVGTYVMLLSRQLVKWGHQVHVVAFGDVRKAEQMDDRGVSVHIIPRPYWHWYLTKVPWLGTALVMLALELERSWLLWRYVRQLHRKYSLDIIERTETGGFFLALWLMQVPQIARLHGEEYTFRKYTPALQVGFALRLARWAQRVALRRASILAANSEAHANEVQTELGNRNSAVTCIPSCIESEKVLSALQTGNQRRGNLLLYVGRLEHRKGIPVLLRAFSHILKLQPNVELILLGSPHSTLPWSELEQLVDQEGIGNQVRFLGRVSLDEVYQWYQKATVCVLPSYYETFGLAALEPMAFGLPVVATRAGGLPEVVQDGKTGILVEPGDSEALSEALSTLLTDAARRENMGAAGRAWALSRFRVEDVSRQMLELYKTVLAG